MRAIAQTHRDSRFCRFRWPRPRRLAARAGRPTGRIRRPAHPRVIVGSRRNHRPSGPWYAAFGMRYATAHSAPATARSCGAAPRPSVRKRSSKRASRSIGGMPSATITRCRRHSCRRSAHRVCSGRPGAVLRTAGRARAVWLDSPPIDHHAHLQSAAVVAGAGGARLLLRRHGSLGGRIHKGLSRWPNGR